MIPQYKASCHRRLRCRIHPVPPGRHLPRRYYTLNDNIINGRIRGIAGVVGCNNARTRHNEAHIQVVKELIKNDVIVLTTGCNGIACAMEGLLTPESAAVHCGPGLAEVCETVGIPPVLHLGSCVDNSRILLAATEVVKAGGLGKDICDLPAAGIRPGMDERKGHLHRPLLRRLRRLHGLRPAPAHLRRPGVPRLPLQRDGKAVRRHVGSGSRSHQTCPA
jgi:carbon-monoxide dehydrogenase catalytic subunit